MAYVSVPKDLTQVKSKVLFGMTKRQIVCFGAALLMGLPLFFLLRGSVPTSAAALVMIFAMLPGLLFGLYEKHGQPQVTGYRIKNVTKADPEAREITGFRACSVPLAAGRRSGARCRFGR